MEADVSLVLEYIDEVGLEPSPIATGWGHMGAILSDAVLQAGLNYRNIVYPRVKALLDKWPDATTTSEFSRRMGDEDVADALAWRSVDTKKMRTLSDLVEFLREHEVETPEELRERLTQTDFRVSLLQVKGVGTKTVDYLAILTGSSDHAAIDVHLRNFLKSAGVDAGSYGRAVDILRAAAEERGWSLRALDAAIWEFQSDRR